MEKNDRWMEEEKEEERKGSWIEDRSIGDFLEVEDGKEGLQVDGENSCIAALRVTFLLPLY